MQSQSSSPCGTANSAAAFSSLFLSDMHLGARACRDEALLGFLQAHQADKIYLVGDIFDTWHGLGAHWTPNQHAIIQLLLARAQAGTQILYTPGNHDAFFRQYIGAAFGNISVADHVMHQGADGRQYLVIHGDSVDLLAGRFPLVSRLAAKAENSLRGLGDFAQHWLRRFDLPIAARVDWLVARVNEIIRKQDDFQGRLIALARHHGADGIICGHFHQPALVEKDGVIYANCGDWVENSTALAERRSGEMVRLNWLSVPQKSLQASLAEAELIGEV